MARARNHFGRLSHLIDRDALAYYLQRNCVPSPKTIYTGVHKLPPGTMLRCGPDGGMEPEPQGT